MKKQLLTLAAICGAIFTFGQSAQITVNMHLSTSSPAISGAALPGYEIQIWDYSGNGSGNGRSYFTDASGNFNQTITSYFNTGSGYFKYEIRDCQNQLVATHTESYSTAGAQLYFTDSINVPCVNPCDFYAGVNARTTNEFDFYAYATNQRWDNKNVQWYFSDGTSGSGSWVHKQFASVGTHSWIAIHQGCALDSGVVTVTGTCDADFTVDTATSTGGTVNIYNTSVASNPANTLYFFWDFGDGTTSTNPFPQHQYAGNGPYSIYIHMWEVDALGDTICNSWKGDTLGVDSAGNVLKTGFSVNVMDPSTIGMVENDEMTLILFPQPASDIIRIESSEELHSAELVDLSGKVVQAWNIESGSTADLSLNNHASGLYLLKVQGATGACIQKCVIE